MTDQLETETPDATDSDPEEIQTVLAENLEGTRANEKSLENEDSDFIWLKLDGQKRLATKIMLRAIRYTGKSCTKKTKLNIEYGSHFEASLQLPYTSA